MDARQWSRDIGCGGCRHHRRWRRQAGEDSPDKRERDRTRGHVSSYQVVPTRATGPMLFYEALRCSTLDYRVTAIMPVGVLCLVRTSWDLSYVILVQ